MGFLRVFGSAAVAGTLVGGFIYLGAREHVQHQTTQLQESLGRLSNQIDRSLTKTSDEVAAAKAQRIAERNELAASWNGVLRSISRVLIDDSGLTDSLRINPFNWGVVGGAKKKTSGEIGEKKTEESKTE